MKTEAHALVGAQDTAAASRTMSQSRLLTVAGATLSAAVLLHLCGFAANIFVRGGSSIGNVALMEWGIGHDAIFLTEKIVAVALLAAGAAMAVWRSSAIAFAIGLLVFLETLATKRFGGFTFSDWTPWSHAARYLTPLALAVLWAPAFFGGGRRSRLLTAMWVLRLGIAIVFVFHGLQALGSDPGFIDLLIGSARRWLGYSITETHAVSMLKLIGVVDVAVGLLLLVGRWKPLLGWLAFWGLLTASSRLTATGMMSYPQLLIRSSHYLAPLAVGMLGLWLDRDRQSPPAETTADPDSL